MKYFSILFLAVIFNMNVSAQQEGDVQIDPKAAGYYNKSIESLKANNLQDADLYIDSALAVTKDKKFAFVKADITFRQGNWDKAIALLNDYTAMDKENEAAYVLLAKAYYNSKQYDKAIEVNKQIIAVTKDPQKKQDAEERIADIGNIEAVELYNTGLDLSKNNKFDEALTVFDKSLAVKKDPKVYLAKAITYSKMQKTNEAMAELNSAIALDPNFDNAYYMLGSMNYTAKNYKEAVANFNKAIEVSQNEELKNRIKETLKGANMQLGVASFKAKKYDESLEHFNNTLALGDNDQAYLWLGRVQTEKKQWEAALASFTKALEVKKVVTEGQVAYYVGSMYKAKGEMPKALENFKKAETDKEFGKYAKSEIANYNATKDQKKK